MRKRFIRPEDPLDGAPPTFAELLRLYWKKGMTQRELASAVKTSRPNISLILNGRRKVSVAMAQKIAKALSLKGDDLRVFIQTADTPVWSAFYQRAEDHAGELVALVMRDLERAGVNLKNVESVSALPRKTQGVPDAVIVMKNGDIFEMELKIRSGK